MSLSALFKERGSTASQALARAGLGHNTVSCWQNNPCSPNLKSLWKLSRPNNVSIAQVITSLGHQAPGYPKLATSMSFMRLVDRAELSQRKIANILKITSPTISYWNTGYQSPRLVYALPLCHLLEVNIDDLAISLNFDGALSPEVPKVDTKKLPLKDLLRL